MQVRTFRLACVALVTASLLATQAATAGAEELDDLKTEVEQLREIMRQSQDAYETKIQALEQRIQDLESGVA